MYDVRLVPERRALRLAESTVSDPECAARAMHAFLGLADLERVAALFLNGIHQITVRT